MHTGSYGKSMEEYPKLRAKKGKERSINSHLEHHRMCHGGEAVDLALHLRRLEASVGRDWGGFHAEGPEGVEVTAEAGGWRGPSGVRQCEWGDMVFQEAASEGLEEGEPAAGVGLRKGLNWSTRGGSEDGLQMCWQGPVLLGKTEREGEVKDRAGRENPRRVAIKIRLGWSGTVCPQVAARSFNKTIKNNL